MLNVLSKPVDRRSIIELRRLIAAMQRFARGEAFDERAMLEIDSEVISFRVVLRLLRLGWADCRRTSGNEIEIPIVGTFCYPGA